MEQRRGDGRRGVSPRDPSCRLEVANPVREQVGRDSRQPVPQVGIPARAADQELPDDQEGPPVAHDVERLGDRAVLAVTTHNSRLADLWLISKFNRLTFSSSALSISTMRSKPMILVALLLAPFLFTLHTTLLNAALPP